MPIEFAPPSAQVQPFQIPAPQYTDPLETLYRMQQMRTQNIQQQNAQLQLQQAQMQMASNRAMLDAFVQGGGDLDKTTNLMTKSGQVLPQDIITFQNHILDHQTKTATLRKDQQEILKNDFDTASSAYQNVDSQDALNAANAALDKQGVGQSMRITAYPGDPDHMKAMANALGLQSQVVDRQQKGQQVLQSQATTQAETLKGGETARGLAASEIQAAIDPNTGVPSPADYAAIQKRYPQVTLPAVPTPANLEAFLGATVPVKEQPEYQLNKLKLKMGVLGNSEYDQFLVQYARALNKTPAQLTPQEGLASFQQYAEMKQDPVMRNLAIQQKNIAEALAKAQLSQIPTQADIDFTARSLVDHSMSPSQFNELRSGRTAGSLGLRAFERAKELDPNFNLQRADAEFKSMEKTEEAFTSGREAQMVRSNNNLMEHLGLLDQARQALGTGNLPALRVIAQAIGTGLGSDANTTYDLIAGKVADEAAKSFIPSGGGEAERMAQANDFRRTLGNNQISSNIKGLLNLVDSQQRNLTDQYSRGTYRQMGQQLFTPQALATRDQLLGRQPTQGPGGVTYQHTATGPNGHKVGSNDGKTWYDIQTGKPITPQPPVTSNQLPGAPAAQPGPGGAPTPSGGQPTQGPRGPRGAPTPSGGYFYAERKDGTIARFDTEAQYKQAKKEHPELYK